jgi:hypothetical protein
LTFYPEGRRGGLSNRPRPGSLAVALLPIKWIGRRSHNGRFVMGRKDILPVCIKAGALGENLPERDLWISPNHAMYLSGVLIEAKDLVNGVSIVQAERVESLAYFHIELDAHDVIIAEGALSETFIDDDSRGMFHNAHEFRSPYPDTSAGTMQYCAPRLEGAPTHCAAGGPSACRGSVRCAVMWTLSARFALRAGRKMWIIPRRRSVSTSMSAAS